MKSKTIQSCLSLVLTFGVFMFANAATTTNSNVQVTAAGVQTSSVTPVNIPVIQVNGVFVTATSSTTNASTSCVSYLTNFNKPGSNGSDVVKLQNFLNQKFATKLNSKGYYGPVTKSLVQDFQYTYGINPTGNQYVKTTEMINKIVCGQVAVMPLKNYDAPMTKVVSTTPSYKTVPVSIKHPVLNNPINTIPAPVKNVLKDNVSGDIDKKIPAVAGKPTDAKTLTMNATSTSFFDSLKKDFDKIKENYKAYLLVFALVLALFWFLRKAATE